MVREQLRGVKRCYKESVLNLGGEWLGQDTILTYTIASESELIFLRYGCARPLRPLPYHIGHIIRVGEMAPQFP